eukprot:3638433-Rhodomonas_salina.2
MLAFDIVPSARRQIAALTSHGDEHVWQLALEPGGHIASVSICIGNRTTGCIGNVPALAQALLDGLVFTPHLHKNLRCISPEHRTASVARTPRVPIKSISYLSNARRVGGDDPQDEEGKM